jgi:antitoxin YefM
MDFTLPASKVRTKLPQLIQKIAQTGKHLIITKSGQPVAVMLSPEELETLEIKTDAKLLESILQAELDIKNGKLYSHQNVFKNIG